ncbi:hypothetical protein LIA77_08051 [Sarocladium implicatum]|nr:hypothetical protein LIA77_08051 [Sarocladium implicatum]
MGCFGKSKKQRRNSEDERDNTQYWTPHGSIPAKMVDAQVAEVHQYRQPPYRLGTYPGVYRNEEANQTSLFQGYELRNDNYRDLVELPIASRMDFTKKGATLKRVQNRENVHPKDRARVARSDLNDPGPFRAVVPTHRLTGRTYGVAGVMYHPEGNPRAFRRAPVEPLDRHGRQAWHRYQDDAAYNHRVDTWPPRDESADDLQGYETRHRQVRRPQPKPQPESVQAGR